MSGAKARRAVTVLARLGEELAKLEKAKGARGARVPNRERGSRAEQRPVAEPMTLAPEFHFHRRAARP